MTDGLVRNDLIELLERLGSDSDQDALDAARELHTRVSAADLNWGDLLVPDTGGSPEPEPSPGEPEAPADTDADNADSLALIDKMLARPDISEDFRSELEDYKADIAKGDFEDRDHRYIRALHERLS
jgi:hypothetical protein